MIDAAFVVVPLGVGATAQVIRAVVDRIERQRVAAKIASENRAFLERWEAERWAFVIFTSAITVTEQP